MSLTPGSTFGRYQVVSMLGSGGMGDVFLAHDTRAQSGAQFRTTNLPIGFLYGGRVFAGDSRRASRFNLGLAHQLPSLRVSSLAPSGALGSLTLGCPRCVTMSYMKTSTITIRLDDALGRELDQACARTGRTRSDLARDALRRQLALLRFERVRRRVLPLAESQGYLTDDDVFRDVS